MYVSIIRKYVCGASERASLTLVTTADQGYASVLCVFSASMSVCSCTIFR